ncbi:hypothetical protein KAR91_68740 [Candidatus Pacearchaeota archaeon]|nr:hypothetical protein [Candidatus Pacearchaeota archaeon]
MNKDQRDWLKRIEKCFKEIPKNTAVVIAADYHGGGTVTLMNADKYNKLDLKFMKEKEHDYTVGGYGEAELGSFAYTHDIHPNSENF